MACPGNLITPDKSIPSGLRLYANGLPGVTLSLFDDLTKDEQEDYLEFWDDIYQRSWDNFVSDVQTLLADKFHIDMKLVSRETSKFLAAVNDSSDLAGVTIEYTHSRYSRLHVSSVEVYLDAPIFLWIASVPPSYAYRSVAYGNGVWVAVGSAEGSLIGAAYSTDGLAWTSSPISSTRNWVAVTFAEHLDLFVAVSTIADGSTAGQRIATTRDGVAWTLQTTPSDLTYSGIASGNGVIIAIAGGTTIIRSTDGETWTAVTVVDHDMQNPVFGDGKFVVSGENFVMVSTDGLVWTAVAVPGSVEDIAYANGVFVAGIDDVLYRSVDGLTWVEVADYPDAIISVPSLFGVGGLFFLPIDSTTAAVSSDGEHWSIVNGGGSLWDGMAYGGGKIVGVSDTLIAAAEVDTEIPGFGTIFIYEDDADGELLGSFTIDSAEEGKNAVAINQDFDADKLFVAINPTGYFRKTANKYFSDDSLSNDKLSCTFPCGYGEGSITQINGGGLNVKFNVYCSIEKFVCENINLFRLAFWYRIGVELMIERRLSDRFNRWTTLTTERAEELNTIYHGEYDKHLKNSVKSLSMREDPVCFQCGSIVDTSTVLP